MWKTLWRLASQPILTPQDLKPLDVNDAICVSPLWNLKTNPHKTIHVQSHDWATENQQLRKELLAREKRIEELEAMASTLNNQLSEKIDQINDMMQKMISLMTTNGDATLLDSLRQSVVTEVRAEFEAREQKLKEAYAHEREKLTSDFNARLAVYQDELNHLKG